MLPKRIVITGGPSTGKTALINHLQSHGHFCMPEISREVIKNAQQEGIEQLFLTNPLLFSQMLLEGREEQFNQAQRHTDTSHLFYDRGLPDVTAYMDYIGAHYPHKFAKACQQNRYDQVFLLPPWRDIYTQDKERYETFEQANKIHHYLHEGYALFDYSVTEVPKGTLDQRMDFILTNLI